MQLSVFYYIILKTDYMIGECVMTIIEVENRNTALINKLLEVWKDSVKATHIFLSNEEIKNIKEYVPQALKNRTFNNYRKWK